MSQTQKNQAALKERPNAAVVHNRSRSAQLATGIGVVGKELVLNLGAPYSCTVT